ncbi:MAG: DUF192 domain-containing protein [Candidatus Omnitrophota bacterium]
MRILVIIMVMLCLAIPVCLSAQQACFKDICFDVELAITPSERNQGLTYKEVLDRDSGMLFVYDKEDKQCFWMKNMLIPLDIIWLNKDKEVVHIQENAQPCEGSLCSEICPEQKAKYVLELNAGTCDLLDLGLGDELSFDYP